MRKIFTLLALLVFVCLQSSGQDRTISGKIISSQDNLGIPGVSVVVEGTTIGTSTDVEGKYSLSVPAKAKRLRYSGVGLTTKFIDLTESNVIDVTMEPGAINLNPVVVTALGVPREEKSLGYATQQVTGSEVSTAKEANFINSLQGKVAGVTISGSSNIGGSSRILLRGIRSINFENQPLFIVDGVQINNANFATRDQARGALGYDYGNAAQDINPEDIESINVLKGSAATALYGSEGANGVIIITTKKGVARTKGPGRLPIGISISTGVNLSDVLIFPTYQNKYGGGAASTDPNQPGVTISEFIPSDIHPGELRSNFEYDGSWGPVMNGQSVYQWDSYYPSLPTYNQKTPWSPHPSNIEDFYQTGVTVNNSVALDGGNENSQFRLSYTNFNDKGIVPNSYLNRNVVSFNGSNRFSNKFTASLSLNYIRANATGRPQTGYNNLASNFTQWWERQLNMEELKDYKNPDGTQRAWNMNSETDPSPLYWDNPYWTCYENYETDLRNRYYGAINLSYDLFKNVTLNGSLQSDHYNDGRQERVAVGSALATSISKYSVEDIEFNENTYLLNLTLKQALNDNFDFTGLIGVSRKDRKTTDDYATTQGGLKVPGYYSLNNSVDAIASFNSDILPIQQLRKNSIYASLSLGFKRFLYLDLTGRNDWSSTLPPENSSYFYPSATASFIFSELTHAKWLSYGKVRAGWAQTAIDPVPYATDATRPQVTDNFIAGPGTYATAVVPNLAHNPDLKPERTSSWELGLEVAFLNGRLSGDFTYYNSLSKDVIFNVQQSITTGFNTKTYNAAELSNKGIEVQLKGIPVQTKSGFEWGLGVNYAKNENIVEKLFTDENGKETESVLLENAPFSATFQARPGESYGQIVGYDYAYDQNGNHIIDPGTGAYARTAKVVPLGSVLPNFTGGFTTWVAYKGFRLTGVIDFQDGGKLFSLTNTWGKYSGTLEETAEGNIREEGLVLDGVVQTGVDAQGNPISDGTKNTTKIAAVDHFFLDGGYVITAADVYDASFVKFRELTLSFSFPQKWFKNTTIQGVTFSLVGRNLAIIHKNIPNIDPESAVSTKNIQGLEGGQLPTTRTMGASLNVRF
jgi:TonB-linked SusC/RagA family outer membrane protein